MIKQLRYFQESLVKKLHFPLILSGIRFKSTNKKLVLSASCRNFYQLFINDFCYFNLERPMFFISNQALNSNIVCKTLVLCNSMNINIIPIYKLRVDFFLITSKLFEEYMIFNFFLLSTFPFDREINVYIVFFVLNCDYPYCIIFCRIYF